MHTLTTPENCHCDKKNNISSLINECPVCDWGLSVCSVCNKGESELEGPCLSEREKIDKKLKEAGMITLTDILNNNPFDEFHKNAGVHSLSTFSDWLDIRYEEMLKLKSKMILEKKDEDELYEWVLSHAAVLGEVRANFKAINTKIN